jgi:hypothetical protein
MIKCIYDTTTGRIYTFSRPDHDVDVWLNQFENADWIEIDEIPDQSKVFLYKVDLDTLRMVEVQATERVGIPKTI